MDSTPPTHMTLIEKLEAAKPFRVVGLPDDVRTVQETRIITYNDCIAIVRQHFAEPPTDKEVERESGCDCASKPYHSCIRCCPAHERRLYIDEENLAVLIAPIIEKASAQEVHPVNVGRRIITELLPYLCVSG